MMTEENVVSKVADLMETLDHIKRYNALARSLKKFALIIIGSIIVFIGLGVLLAVVGVNENLNRPLYFVIGFFLLLVPVLGLVSGILYVRKRVNSAKTGDWKEPLSQGFPAALEILLELDWDETFNEINIGKLSYVIYGLLKTGAYWFITYFTLSIVVSVITQILPHLHIESSLGLGLIALFVVLLFLGKDLLKRYKEVQSLDMLLWELRWFSFELGRAEFQA